MVRFSLGGKRFQSSPGDESFAAANEIHRFEDFTDNLLVWVAFYGLKAVSLGIFYLELINKSDIYRCFKLTIIMKLV
jgi:hypothetical protein